MSSPKQQARIWLAIFICLLVAFDCILLLCMEISP